MLKSKVAPQPFGYFRTVKSVLDSALGAVRVQIGLSETEMGEALVKHLKTMSNEWFSGTTPNIVYSDPLCRLAYLYCHVSANANLCEVAITQTPAVANLINARIEEEEELRVCAFGGGPGTELLAISKYLLSTSRAASPATISFTILDRVQEWAETWTTTERTVTNYLKSNYGPLAKRPFSIASKFCTFDITKIEQFCNLVDLFGQDLFVLNYVVSEVLGGSQKLQAVVNKMAESAPEGAIFLVVDREQKEVIKRAKTLLKDAGLSVGEIATSRRAMDGDEQISDLQPYVKMVGRNPRSTWGNRAQGWGAFWKEVIEC